ncbi:MAG: hypothetical protein COX81_01840 [Candidatus Magasanikbacteria bacterium CG_4_10_14_0_2_um_filter_37_12]|uniref:UDP-N-acetylglucosamine--N-acetylmuramyl-(pentapeptide) pyrophosphoryl-undecaprenol N-acetylglucosamine transferase n=1 Tax=Candidatus Magasanikbacteria bacterium CG_4_10_14_0_2_um_filter_37_12 TaxID=1974637 RepID=A0A2M7V8J3_9BACT|nr:MAG: hypothetical protein COX81_01840 [Candidatus Magasanikbacteria bacterium CG_4_10_14_0_2_um_filter_37_12]
MKIIFSGGGTLGPVTPLLAIYETIKKKYPTAEFIWVGTKTGPERELVEKEGIEFRTIVSGKLRRYFSVFNIFDFFKTFVGVFQSIAFLWKENPEVCISAGGFVSVPLHWAAWFVGVPTWIHQQDVRVGLANRLMSPFAKKITVVLDLQLKDFSRRKSIWLGNPIRKDILFGNKEEAIRLFNLKQNLPTVFVTGGGTGSLKVNQLIVEAIYHLQGHAQIIHLTGKERPQELSERAEKHFDNYQVHQFFTDEMKYAYAVADLVISRAGFGTISELAALSKAAILVPKPGHQEENVTFLKDTGAVVFVSEKTSTGLLLAKLIKELLEDKAERIEMGRRLAEMMPVAEDEDILEILKSLIS